MIDIDKVSKMLQEPQQAVYIGQLQACNQYINYRTCKSLEGSFFRRFVREEEEVYQCRTMDKIWRIRELIAKSDYLELKQRPLYCSHVIKILITPLMRLLGQWKANACKGCQVPYGDWLEPYNYLFGRSINGQISERSRNRILLANIA